MRPFTSLLDRCDGTVVFLAGELDAATAPQLDDALKGVTGHVTFDCSGLAFVDSSGLAIFDRVNTNGGASFRDPRPNVRRALEITKFDELILARPPDA
jgi:anti-anti-sigma factor